MWLKDYTTSDLIIELGARMNDLPACFGGYKVRNVCRECQNHSDCLTMSRHVTQKGEY